MPVKRESFLADPGAVRVGLLSRCVTHALSNLAARGRNSEERGIIAGWMPAGWVSVVSDQIPDSNHGPTKVLLNYDAFLTQGFLILNESWRIASNNLPQKAI